ncbi:hypothetical protein Ddye_030312 [Dipteronia dyeriana]|uniref:SWIM-type domain-containing protein n=1 Tax=Dipteronia dyeriana TaxID=168575 RepID=A0AAD9WMJ6_9ROSI|nr:hypothetical protein Ddye_030312 [Dipteronia dyeriana]
MPIEIVDDKDVALLLRRENVDPLVCISVEEISHETPEIKHKQPESSHNIHHVTSHHEFHYTHKSNIQVSTMDEIERSDVPNMVAHLDDIRVGLQSPSRNFSLEDTMGNQHIPEHEETETETETQFNYIPERVFNRYDEQFAHVQRLVLPPCTFYSINSGEVAPRPVTMRLEVGELFPSKKQLKSQLGNYALANRFQIMVFKSDTTRYQVRCIVEDCNWRLHTAKVRNSDYFHIRKFDNQHTCSTEARFQHQRQASARVIEEQIQEKFCDHRSYKPKEIIHDMQREFGISCNYHKGYRARHIALEEFKEHRLSHTVFCHHTYTCWSKQILALVQTSTHISLRVADVTIGVKDEKARYMRVYPITFYMFHVKDGGLDRNVDLTTKTCTCKEFDVDQLPCAHALTCIRLWGFSFVDYCSPYYSSAFLATVYSGEIHPFGQPSEW